MYSQHEAEHKLGGQQALNFLYAEVRRHAQSIDESQGVVLQATMDEALHAISECVGENNALAGLDDLFQ